MRFGASGRRQLPPAYHSSYQGKLASLCDHRRHCTYSMCIFPCTSIHAYWIYVSYTRIKVRVMEKYIDCIMYPIGGMLQWAIGKYVQMTQNLQWTSNPSCALLYYCRYGAFQICEAKCLHQRLLRGTSDFSIRQGLPELSHTNNNATGSPSNSSRPTKLRRQFRHILWSFVKATVLTHADGSCREKRHEFLDVVAHQTRCYYKSWLKETRTEGNNDRSLRVEMNAIF